MKQRDYKEGDIVKRICVAPHGYPVSADDRHFLIIEVARDIWEESMLNLYSCLCLETGEISDWYLTDSIDIYHVIVA